MWRPSTVDRILPYVFLCTIGPSVTAATNINVVRILMCRILKHSADTNPGDDLCSSANVEALTGSVMAGLATLDGVCAFLSSSIIQRLADRHGRRLFLILLPSIATISTLAMWLAYMWPNNIAAWLLLLVNGVFVSASTKAVFLPTLCIADIATEEERTRYYSRAEAVALLGPGTAYVMSALISRQTGSITIPYYVSLSSQVLAALYALAVLPETLSKSQIESQVEADEEDDRGQIEAIEEAVIAPIKPLGLLLPRRDGKTGASHWRLMLLSASALLTTSGTIFVATASLLLLSDKYGFNAEKNAWVLAFLTFSRFAYLILLFPFIVKYGRKAYDAYKKKFRQESNERTALIAGDEAKKSESNHFDVLLALFSISVDAISLGLVALSSSIESVLIAFGVMAFGAGDNPTFKSVFAAAVPPEQASEVLAALDMLLSVAKLVSPPLLGSIYAAFVQIGKPEMMFLTAGGFCALGALLTLPLVFVGRK